MPWEIPKKISLLAVAILFLFTFFTLILDALDKWVLATEDIRIVVYPYTVNARGLEVLVDQSTKIN